MGLLSNAQKAVKWLALSMRQSCFLICLCTCFEIGAYGMSNHNRHVLHACRSIAGTRSTSTNCMDKMRQKNAKAMYA